jgi:hypothetical protein
MEASQIRTQYRVWFLVKSFAWCGGVYGLVTAGGYLLSGQPDTLGWALFRGAGFGALMTLFFTPGQGVPARYRGRSGVLSTTQAGWILVNRPKQEVLDGCRDALAAIGARDVRDVGNDPPAVAAYFPWSFMAGGGEKLRVALTPTPDGAVRVEVSSRPSWRWSMADRGKNLRNVEAILDGIARLTGTDGMAARR